MKASALRIAAAAVAVLALGEAMAQPHDANDANDARSARDVYLEVDVTPREVYVQAQLTCVLRIYRAVEFFEATLSDFQPEGAVIHRLGRDSRDTRVIDGRRYQIIERRFAVFPQASGRFTLPAIRLDARIAHADAAPARGGVFDPGRKVRIETEPVEVVVKPRPGAAATPWLPARALTLTEEWPEYPPRLAAGEPVVWTLRLQAAGLSGEQLPPIEASGIEGARVYPDQPSVSNRFDADAVHGERIQPLALLAGAAGELELPELRVEWWDVEADAPRIARIPARTVTIAPAPAERTGSAAVSVPVATAAGARLWQGISVALATVWLVTLAALLRIGRRRSRQDSRQPAGNAPRDTSAARRRVLDACRGSNPRAARDGLLRWAGAVWPDSPPRDLIALAPRVDDASFAEAILDLDDALWSSRNRDWTGRSLADRLPRVLGPGTPPGRTPAPDRLPSLHPA